MRKNAARERRRSSKCDKNTDERVYLARVELIAASDALLSSHLGGNLDSAAENGVRCESAEEVLLLSSINRPWGAIHDAIITLK